MVNNSINSYHCFSKRLELTMPCKICGEILLVGKNSDDTALWCPKCNGIEVLGRSEMIKLSAEELKKTSEDKNNLFRKYDKKSIIGSLCASLEAVSMERTTFRHICSISYALKNVLSKKAEVFGSKRMPYTDLQHLLQIYDFEFQEMYVNHSLINDGYVVGVIIPPDKISEYAMNQYHLRKTTKETVARFTEDWNFNRLIAVRYGLYSQNELLREHTGPKQWSPKSIYNDELNRIKYLFQFTVGTSKLSKDLKSNVDLIDGLKQLSEDLFYLFVPDFNIGELSGTIHTTSKSEIIESLSKAVSNPDEIYGRIINIEFPLIIEIENLCFVLPNTCAFYLQLLYSQKYENELNQEKSIWGDLFEELVFKTVELFGYNVINPLDNKPLLNFIIEDQNDQINGKARSFELDVAGFKDDSSIIVECKHWDIGSGFFKRRSIEKRKKELQAELKKFQHKIDLIKTDDKYSFLMTGKNLDAFLVTLHPEPIEQYGDIKIVSFNQFTPRRTEFSSDEKTELKMKKEEAFTERNYKNGKKLIGIDFTKMIVNPYGINHFRIEPENEFKSYVYVGDGIVNSFDHEELVIDTPCSMRVIVDLIEEDFAYLKSRKITKNCKVRYQIYTTDPLLSTYYLRFIRKI